MCFVRGNGLCKMLQDSVGDSRHARVFWLVFLVPKICPLGFEFDLLLEIACMHQYLDVFHFNGLRFVYVDALLNTHEYFYYGPAPIGTW